MVRYGQGALNKTEAFIHKHTEKPHVPTIGATVIGFFLGGPIGALIGAGAGYTGSRVAYTHLTAKAGGPLQPAGTTSSGAVPTGYTHLSGEPSKALQDQAAAYLKGILLAAQGKSTNVIGTTKKVAFAGKNYLFRIEKHPPDPARGLPTEHPGVTVYEKV